MYAQQIRDALSKQSQYLIKFSYSANLHKNQLETRKNCFPTKHGFSSSVASCCYLVPCLLLRNGWQQLNLGHNAKIWQWICRTQKARFPLFPNLHSNCAWDCFRTLYLYLVHDHNVSPTPNLKRMPNALFSQIQYFVLEYRHTTSRSVQVALCISLTSWWFGIHSSPKKNDPHQQGHPDAMSWNMSAEAQFLAFVMHAKDACLPQPFEKKGYPSRMGHQCEPNHEHSTEKQYVSLKKYFIIALKTEPFYRKSFGLHHNSMKCLRRNPGNPSEVKLLELSISAVLATMLRSTCCTHSLRRPVASTPGPPLAASFSCAWGSRLRAFCSAELPVQAPAWNWLIRDTS